MAEKLMRETPQDRDPEKVDEIPPHMGVVEDLPTFGVTVKLHKSNKLRFMAKSHRSSLVGLAKWISKSMSAMMQVSEEIWKDLFMSIGIVTNSSWVINSSKDIRSRMDRMTKMGMSPDLSQQTYDFSTMYTALQLEDLRENMSEFIALVFEYAKQNKGSKEVRGEDKVLVVTYRGNTSWKPATATPDETDYRKNVTANRLNKWIRHLLDSLHVTVGGQIYRQVTGVPMGTSCSPFLANIMLFIYELRAMTKYIQSPPTFRLGSKRHNFLTKLAFSTRYIDDLWNPLLTKKRFTKIAKNIYPAWLPLDEPESEGPSVNYLDMSIWCDNTKNIWHSKLYDKRVELIKKGLKLNRFPHPQSKLATQCKLGVITSQLHRYNIACTQPKDFLAAATSLYTAYIEKGYQPQVVNQYFEKFRRRHTPHLRPRYAQQRHEKEQRRREGNTHGADPVITD